MTDRRHLHNQLWAMGSDCEWPDCGERAAEMAHIHPRGMGHKGARDTLDNVMRACSLHARVSDGIGSGPVVAAEWAKVTTLDVRRGVARDILTRRIRVAREAEGFVLDQ